MQELSPGALIGHYKLTRCLGQGGMGVVWGAVDQRLGRSVAVKFLTEANRDNSEALERFWREAKAASALNHPGICTIYELNESGETPFLVMELLEGSSLEKLYRGRAMTYPKLLELGVQLADALDAAHRKGILHRDIKPANIFITSSEQAKLLDFGLAKLEDVSRDGDARTDPDSPTAVNQLTSSGSSVGTIAYMSPEQARAQPLDARSDLFSLGVVLYEMATGRHPFMGASTAVVFDRILNHAPAAPVSLNPQLPVEFEAVLFKTLEKDRELRCQAAAELRADLKRLQRKSGSGGVDTGGPSRVPASGPASGPGVARAKAPRGRFRRAIVAVALALLVVSGIAAWRLRPKPRLFAEISVDQVTNAGTLERLAISGDGRFLGEVKNDKGQRTLWVRNTVTNTDTQILGPFANHYLGLTFSPDGNYLYFTRGTPQDDSLRALYRMPIFGGAPKQLIVDIDSTVSFAPDGNHFTFVRYTPDRKDQFSEVHIADTDGGDNHLVYVTAEQISPPVWSPDGVQVAWIGTVSAPRRSIEIQLFNLTSKKLTILPISPNLLASLFYTNLVWAPDGRHLITLYSKPDTDHFQIGIVTVPSGEFHTLTNDVNSYSQPSISADGRTLATILTNVDSDIAWYKGEGGAPVSTTPLRAAAREIAWTDEDHLVFDAPYMAIGTIDRLTGSLRNFDMGEIYPGPGISVCPDGHVLFSGVPKGQEEYSIIRVDADGGNPVQLTTKGIAYLPFCSSDSSTVYFSVTEPPRQASLWAMPLGGGAPRPLYPGEKLSSGAFFSKDGRLASWETVLPNSKITWKVLDLASRKVVHDVVLDQSDYGRLHYSQDERALVYPVLRNGERTLLYQPFEGPGQHTLIDPVPDTISDFAWSPSGRQLAVLRVKSSSDVVLIKDRRASGKD